MPYWAKTLSYRTTVLWGALLIAGCATAPETGSSHTVNSAYVALGREYLMLDATAQARQAFEKAHAHRPSDPAALHGLALCAHLTQAPEDAEGWYREAQRAARYENAADLQAQIAHNYASLLYDAERYDGACRIWLAHRHLSKRTDPEPCPYSLEARHMTPNVQG